MNNTEFIIRVGFLMYVLITGFYVVYKYNQEY